MALTDITIRNLKPEVKGRKIADKNGLYLYITPRGTKVWRWDFHFGGKRLTRTFGKWPRVGLGQARELRETSQALLDRGLDPRLDGLLSLGDTFEDVGNRWLTVNESRWTSKTTRRIKGRVEAYLYPHLGPRPINQIEASELLAVLRKVEAKGLGETTHRLRNYAGRIFRFAVAEGIAKRDPSHDIIDALHPVPKTRNRASLDATELPEYFKRLSNEPLDQVTRDALDLTMLTAARTGEIRFAAAQEFEGLDSEHPLWRVPAERMKMRLPHLVPLSPQAVNIVKRRIDKAPRQGLLFASPTRSGAISENTMLFALYRLGYHSKATVHGFRGTFSTIANEHEWNRDWIEMCLAHVQGGVRGVYNSAQYLKGRRQLLQWWADYLDEARLRASPKTT